MKIYESKYPIIRPPRWAVILILGTNNVKTRFIPRRDRMLCLPAGLIILGRRCTRYRKAPNSPNKLPEAPADTETKLKKKVAKFPPIPVRRKKIIYFLGPRSISICGPNTYKAYPLKSIWVKPI